MSKFLIYRDEIDKAIQSCLSATSEYRNQNQTSEVPFPVIQDLVQKHIQPLGGSENKLNIKMPDESKSDWRKNATEVVFRRTLLQMIDLEQSDEKFNKIFDCLDIVLYCTETSKWILSFASVCFIGLIGYIRRRFAGRGGATDVSRRIVRGAYNQWLWKDIQLHWKAQIKNHSGKYTV